jgi:predicted RNase H-like nuclease (RuvC/YqgF family)
VAKSPAPELHCCASHQHGSEQGHGRGAVDDHDEKWLAQPWKIPALQIWAKMYHKYEGMTGMLTGTMMEELATIITCVTGDARHRRTIYEADQDVERFGKTLIANFKDTATLWEFLRASLRQCHIRKLSKVGKDNSAWAKADEYLTNLMDSDTVLTLENTDEAINRAQNYMQRQDNDGEKHVAFSSASDESDGEEVKALRAALKEEDQGLSALEAKFNSFSSEQKDGSNKRKKPARKNGK